MASTSNAAGHGLLGQQSPLRFVDLYLTARRRIMPLNGKRPVEPNWTKLPFRAKDRLQLDRWYAQGYNFGLVLDETDLVIDVDRHDPQKDGYESLRRLLKDLGCDALDKLTPVTVATGNNGLHLLFRKPPELKVRKSHPDYPGLEFLTAGHQIVALGAIHPDTKARYHFGPNGEFNAEQLRRPRLAPQALLAWLSTRPDEPPATTSRSLDEAERARVGCALSHIDPDVPYDTWLKVLMALHSLGHEEVYLPMADRWSALGGKYEPEGDNAVATKWRSFRYDAFAGHQITVSTLCGLARDSGWNGQPEHFGQYCIDHDGLQAAVSTNTGTQPIPLTTIMANEYRPLTYLIDELLPDSGAYLLSSNPKVGKTTLIHQMCLALCMGAPFIGKTIRAAGGVLFLALEDAERRLQLRTKQILGGSDFEFCDAGSSLERLQIATQWPHGAEGIDALEKYLSDHPEIALVVIDTFAAFRGPDFGAKRNVFQEEYEFIKNIKAVADKHETCILILHHNRKGPSDTIGETISGTFGIAAAVDGYMVLTSMSFADAEFQLAAQGREVAPTELALKRVGHAFRCLGDAFEYKQSDERKEVLELLDNHPDGLRAPEIAAELGRTAPSTRKLLATMYKRGLLNKIGRGLYARGGNDGRNGNNIAHN